MVSQIFTDSNTLFPPEASKASADNQAALYQDAYGGNADASSQTNAPDTNAQSAYAVQNRFLPSVQLAGDGDPATGKSNSIDSLSPKDAQTIAALQTVLNDQSNNGVTGISKDSVFNEPITNNPDVLDRAAKAFTQDTENMLTYMALMKSDSAKLTAISDPATVTAMQAAMAKQWEPMKEQTMSNLTKLGIDPDTTKQVADLLQTLDQKLLTKPGSANSQTTDTTATSASPANSTATDAATKNTTANDTSATNTTQPDPSQFAM